MYKLLILCFSLFFLTSCSTEKNEEIFSDDSKTRMERKQHDSTETSIEKLERENLIPVITPQTTDEE